MTIFRLSRFLSILLVASLSSISGRAAEITVSGKATGKFGSPENGGEPMVEAYVFAAGGELIEITATGNVNAGAGDYGPDGHTFIRADLIGGEDVAFLPMEERILDSGGWVGEALADGLVPRVGGLFAAFVPQDTVDQPGFEALDEDGVAVGISSSSLFFIGAEKFNFRSPSAGKLYLGVADPWSSDNTGEFTVTVNALVAGEFDLTDDVVFLHALQNGQFGFPINDSGSGGRYMLPAFTFSNAGQGIQLTGSRTITGGGVVASPGGTLLSRDPLIGGYPEAFTPWEEGFIARGGIVPTTDRATTVENFAGILGAFVPHSQASENFRAIKDGRFGIDGIDPVDLFLVGYGTEVIASEPGTLFLGINHAWVDGWEGAYRVALLERPGIFVSTSSDTVEEGGSVSVTLTLNKASLQDVEIKVSLPLASFNYDQTVIIPAGQLEASFVVESIDDELISTHQDYQIVAEAAEFLSGQATITVLDNDWSGFDENQNRLSDIWERVHGIYGADPNADPDGDGLTNFVEDKWGTDPHDGNSIPHFKPVPENSTETETCMEFHFIGGKRFQIQATSDLKTWEDIGEIVVSEGELEEIMIEQEGNHEFYRLVGLESVDTDGDGLADDDEALLGTDSRNRDTDRDGLADGFEMQRFVSLNNYGEPSGGTPPVSGAEGSTGERSPSLDSPTNPDEDGNGVPDGYDVVLYVASATAKNLKRGYPAYESRTSNIQGPPPGLDRIPVFQTETRSWSYTGWDINIPADSDCHGKIAEPNWGSGTVTWTMDEWGNETVNDPGPLPNNWTKWHQRDSSSPYGQAIRKQYGFLQPFEFGPVAGDPASQGFSATFEQSQYGGFCADAVNGNLWATGWASVTGSLTNEFTTEDNIAFTIEKARGNLGLLKSSSAASGEVDIPGTMTGFGNGGAWERIASINVSDYKFKSVQGTSSQVCAVVLEKTNSDATYQVKAAGASGSLPTITNEPVQSSLFYMTPVINSNLDTFSDWPDHINLDVGGSVSFQLRGMGGGSLADMIVREDFTASVSGGEVILTWSKSSKTLGVVITNCGIPEAGESEVNLTVNLGGQCVFTTGMVSEFPEAYFLTPAGNPAGDADLPGGANDSGLGKNEFVFSSESQGKLSIHFEALIQGINRLPSEKIISLVKFEVPPIGSSQQEFVLKENGHIVEIVGDKVSATVVFTGLPAKTSDFGLKTVRLKFGGRILKTQDYEVFFPKHAKNHPDNNSWSSDLGKPENWFYYWKEGGVCGIPDDAIFDGRRPNIYGYTIPDKDSIVRLGAKAPTTNSFSTYDSGTADYGEVTVGAEGIGIECVSQIVAHELYHIELHAMVDEAPHLDMDNDTVLNDLEEGLNGIKSDPSFPDTFNLRLYIPDVGYDKIGDGEIRCRKIMNENRIPFHPSKDWAHPGSQTKLKFGP